MSGVQQTGNAIVIMAGERSIPAYRYPTAYAILEAAGCLDCFTAGISFLAAPNDPSEARTGLWLIGVSS